MPTTARLRATPPPADRSVLKLVEAEETHIINFVVALRRVVRRATSEGHDAANVLAAFEQFLADWSDDRRVVVLRAVAAAFDDLVRLPARPTVIPCRANGDGFGDVA
jgi:hypothetical protein